MADNDRPITRTELRAELAGLATKEELREELGRMEQRLIEREEHLIERMRDMQTEILRGFESFARRTDATFA